MPLTPNYQAPKPRIRQNSKEIPKGCPRKSPEITPFHKNHGFSSPQRCKFSRFFLLGLQLRLFLRFRKSWDRASEEACENHDLSKSECQNVGGAANGPRALSRVPAQHKSRDVTRGDSATVPQALGTGSAPLCRGIRMRRTGRTAGGQSSRTRMSSGAVALRGGLTSLTGADPARATATTTTIARATSVPYVTLRGKCFERNGLTPVPGCKGTGKYNWDYCIYEEA
eukprot:scaffold8612_cov66-Phaeocystis_antarctica.AAC.4